jgi:hypothetical protein
MEVLPGDSGGGAGDVTILFQHQGEQLLGGSELQRVVEVGCLSHPSQTYFQFRLPALGYTRAAGVAYAGGFSLTIEAVLTDAGIVGMDYVQGLSPAGQLLDQMEVFWQSPDGTADGSIVVALPPIDEANVAALVAAAMAPYL